MIITPRGENGTVQNSSERILELKRDEVLLPDRSAIPHRSMKTGELKRPGGFTRNSDLPRKYAAVSSASF